MDKLYFIFDEKGNFITQNYFSEPPEGGICIEDNPINEGFIKIKYDWQNLCYYEGATPEEIAQATKPIVPEKAKKSKIKLALIRFGVSTSLITDYIYTLPPSLEKDKLIVLWEDEEWFYRNDESLNAMSPVFKISQEQLDQLFILADTL